MSSHDKTVLARVLFAAAGRPYTDDELRRRRSRARQDLWAAIPKLREIDPDAIQEATICGADGFSLVLLGVPSHQGHLGLQDLGGAGFAGSTESPTANELRQNAIATNAAVYEAIAGCGEQPLGTSPALALLKQLGNRQIEFVFGEQSLPLKYPQAPTAVAEERSVHISGYVSGVERDELKLISARTEGIPERPFEVFCGRTLSVALPRHEHVGDVRLEATKAINAGERRSEERRVGK